MYHGQEWINFVPYAFGLSLFTLHELVKLFDKSSFKIKAKKAEIINEVVINN